MASAKQPTDGHAAEEPGATGNLPARIDSAPTPPAAFERLDAAPEDDTERFAFALWHAGRKEEAVEFLERQIARRGGDEALKTLPMTLDIAPTPVTFVPRRRSRRPAIAVGGGAILALAVAVLWTGGDRLVALPAWIGGAATQADAQSPDASATEPASDSLALTADDESVERAAGAAPATTGAVVLTASETPPPDELAFELSRTVRVIETAADGDAPIEAPADAAVDTAEMQAAAPETAPETAPTPSPHPPAATGLARLPAAEEAAAPAPPVADVAAAEAAPGPLPPASEVAASGPPAEADAEPVQLAEAAPVAPAALDGAPEETGAVTLAALADAVIDEVRLPRPRPEPSPETIAAVTRPGAPTRDPYYVVPEPDYVVPEPPYAAAPPPAAPGPYVPAAPPSYAGAPRTVPYAPPPSYRSATGGRLTILGRVGRPPVIYRRTQDGRIYRYSAPPFDGALAPPWGATPQR